MFVGDVAAVIDLAKSLDVKPNAAIRVGPNVDAGILAIAEAGDKATVTGLRGRWTQISLEKSLVGYIKVGATTAAAAAPAPRQSNPAPRPAAAPAPAASAPTAAAPMGQAVPMVNQGDGGASTLPRQFAGTFVSTRRPLRPRRPYDYALHDDAGRRYAYVDISKLLQTEQIDRRCDGRPVLSCFRYGYHRGRIPRD